MVLRKPSVIISHIINILDGDNLTFLDQANTLKYNLSNRDYILTVPGSNLNHAEIVSVEVVTGYDRYVFDLETMENWFTVNDYIVHNCVQIPLGKLFHMDSITAMVLFVLPSVLDRQQHWLPLFSKAHKMTCTAGILCFF